MPKGAEVEMQFAESHMAPGHNREVHWHINSGEWVKKGMCEFTLMDNEGRFNIDTATEGDVWYFPKGWQHSFQALHPDHGCDVLLSFDTNDLNIDITHIIAEMPFGVVKGSLNSIPDKILRSMMYPLYNNDDDVAKGILAGSIQTSLRAKCKGEDKTGSCTGSLKHRPVFPMKGGKRLDVPGAGVEYQVKNDLFPATLTMSGGLIELVEGTIRKIGIQTLNNSTPFRVTVYGVDQDTRENVKATFTLHEGYVCIVPSTAFTESLIDDQ